MKLDTKCCYGPMMSSYNGSDCANNGEHYRDRTVTGIGDFRHFCDEHIEEADVFFEKEDFDRKISYLRSVVATKELEVRKATDRLNKTLGIA